MITLESPWPGVYATIWVKYAVVHCYTWIDISLWCRDLDINQISGKKHWWLLHTDAENGNEWQRDKWGSLRKSSKIIFKGTTKMHAPCRSHHEKRNRSIKQSFALEKPYGWKKLGIRSKNYIDNLLGDTGLTDIKEMKTLMKDRDRWKERIL